MAFLGKSGLSFLSAPNYRPNQKNIQWKYASLSNEWNMQMDVLKRSIISWYDQATFRMNWFSKFRHVPITSWPVCARSMDYTWLRLNLCRIWVGCRIGILKRPPPSVIVRLKPMIWNESCVFRQFVFHSKSIQRIYLISKSNPGLG